MTQGDFNTWLRGFAGRGLNEKQIQRITQRASQVDGRRLIPTVDIYRVGEQDAKYLDDEIPDL